VLEGVTIALLFSKCKQKKNIKTDTNSAWFNVSLIISEFQILKAVYIIKIGVKYNK
jgi:hypothetical protein